jgi:hypothetical protein
MLPSGRWNKGKSMKLQTIKGFSGTLEANRYQNDITSRVDGAQIAFANQNVGPKAAAPSRFSPN